MPQIILSLFSRPTHLTKSESPKNYPKLYAIQLVEKLKENGIKTIQIGCAGEYDLNCDEKYFDKPFPFLKELFLKSDLIIACDNFAPHFAHYYKKTSIVLWAKSDPKLFGYEDNINLLKDRKFLRQFQYNFWEEEIFDKNAFVGPDVVLKAVDDFLLIQN